MLRSRSINLNQNNKPELYFRIVPVSIKQVNQYTDTSVVNWLLYFQKGMQILGRTGPFSIPAPNGEYLFESNGGYKFDFQIVSEKNLGYTWSLYSVDGENMQERVFAENFSIKEYLSKHDKECVRNGYDIELNLKYFTLAFKLFIHTSSFADLTPGSATEGGEQVSKALHGIAKRRNKEKQKLSMILAEKQRPSLTSADIHRPTSEIMSPKKRSLQNEPEIGVSESKENSKIIQKPEENSLKIQQKPSENEAVEDSAKKNILPFLDQITEEKQKQQILTPVARGFKGTTFNQALSAINESKLEQQEQQEHQEHQEHQERQEQVVEQVTQQKQEVFETSQPQQVVQPILVGGNDEEIKAQNVENTENLQNIQTIENLENSLTSQPKQAKIEILTRPDSSLKFKKILIAILLLILVGGIVGAVLSSQTADQPEKKPEQITPTKGKKKAKKPKNKA